MESMRDRMDEADKKMDEADKKMDKNRTDTQAEIANNFKISTGLTVLSLLLSKLSASQVHMVWNFLTTLLGLAV
jgi:hypothetical protein